MLSVRVRAVLDLVEDLSDDERSELRERLDGVLGAASAREWDRAWSDELSGRIAQIEGGEVELVDGDAVLADLRADAAS